MSKDISYIDSYIWKTPSSYSWGIHLRAGMYFRPLRRPMAEVKRESLFAYQLEDSTLRGDLIFIIQSALYTMQPLTNSFSGVKDEQNPSSLRRLPGSWSWLTERCGDWDTEWPTRGAQAKRHCRRLLQDVGWVQRREQINSSWLSAVKDRDILTGDQRGLD